MSKITKCENMKKAFGKVWEDSALPIEEMKEKTFFITGATGLIGQMVIRALSDLNERYDLSLKVIAFIRNPQKAQDVLCDVIESGCVVLCRGDVCSLPEIEEPVDYIIHAASETQSKTFTTNPVEVIKTSLLGTENMLELAKKKQVKGMIFTSSMEIYGFTEEEELLDENNLKYINPLEVRSCYPESKRMAESLCVSYAAEYQVPVKIVRLGQTFGYGTKMNDTRVFGEFARCARDKTDIVLKTTGKSKRMYLDSVDAASAILTILLKGENGKAYNAANPETYCSVCEMGEMVCSELAGGKIEVKIEEDKISALKFSPPHRLMLDISRISELGWKPNTGLMDMYRRLMEE